MAPVEVAVPVENKNKRPLQDALPERTLMDISLLPPKKRYTCGVYERSLVGISMPPAKKASKNSMKTGRVQEAGYGDRKRKANLVNGFVFPNRDVAFSDIPIADELHAELANLGASKPVRVYRKLLSSSDMCAGQSRLLISCKNGRQCPFAKVFTAAEQPLLHDKSTGLQITAYDNVGRSYPLTCKFLDSNKAFRLIKGWRTFLTMHHLDNSQFQHVQIEVWAFRSRELERGLAGQDCGKLGLVLVPYFGSRRPESGIGARNPAPGNAIVPDVKGTSEEGDGKGAKGGEEEVAPAVDAVMAASTAPEVVAAETAWENCGLSPVELEAAVVLMLLKHSRADADGDERCMH